MQVTPKDIYDAYPGSDLLALFPPCVNEAFHTYKARMGGDDGIASCGDTLFTFLLHELEECGTREEAAHLINSAISDLVAVRDSFTKE